ncbi:MAG: hypothetical protein WKG07_25020 [Hymenobacter sp.]
MASRFTPTSTSSCGRWRRLSAKNLCGRGAGRGKRDSPCSRLRPWCTRPTCKKSQAEANYVGIEYQNTKSLADSNIVSKNELALSQGQVRQGQSRRSPGPDAPAVHRRLSALFSGIMDHFQGRLGSRR